MKTWIRFVVMPSVLFAVAGCAKPPADKLAAAEKAVTEARTAGAQNYMAEDFAKLDGMLANAKSEIAEQDEKFGFMRDYDKAEQLLATVQANASRVITEAGKKKEEAKVLAVQAQQAAQNSLKDAQDLVSKAPVGKDRAALQAIKADVDGLTTAMSEVQTAIDAGDYKSAQTKAQVVQDKSQQVIAEIQGALAKVHKAKPGKKT